MMSKTTFDNKCQILGQLWLQYRDETNFKDFIEYNDLGLPLAYAISENIISSSNQAEKLINETFDLLLSGLGVDDTGFDSIDDLFDIVESK